MEYASFYVIFMSFNLTITLIIMLASCLCCRKKIPKNEFIGVEGMVILKNPEDNVACINISECKSSQNDLNVSTTSGADSEKRSSNAPHRSLPDIPLAVAMNDTGSDLYATVADKVHIKPQGESTTSNLKKGKSVSQHSSMSQADDVSSPYARVKTSIHNYDKVLLAEHPYAQLNAAINFNSLSVSPPNSAESFSNESSDSERVSHQSIIPGPESLQEIPAASAIAGMVSASQELPYMTPPIVQQPNFSGDSQDSSKGYTSISVREPLANILAQTKDRHPRLNRGGTDSHYATVSDDSDEMYAAIEDPKNQIDIYTSGSETYAQIQPTNPITVSVEINTISSVRNQSILDNCSNLNSSIPTNDPTPVPLPIDSLRAQMHSRQASSSSNNSSMGILGSPKPEKRQANSPLPPTPKNVQFNNCISSNLTSTNSSLASGRNSVSSVIEVHFPLENSIAEESSPKKKKQSPSKDIEEMYAKVMKKNRLSTSQNNSPTLSRKSIVVSVEENDAILLNELSFSDLEIGEIKSKASPDKNSIKSVTSYISDNKHDIVNRRHARSNSYNANDHGYETIPADKINKESAFNQIEKRKSDSYAQFAQKERFIGSGGSFEIEEDECVKNTEPGYESLPDQSTINSDSGYETLLKNVTGMLLTKPNSDYDPNYETLHLPKYALTSDDGYAKVMDKSKTKIEDDDNIDGYSKVKINKFDDDNSSGYSRIGNPKKNVIINLGDKHGYASISDTSNMIVEEHELLSCFGNENNNEPKTIENSSLNIQNCSNKNEYESFQTLSSASVLTSPIKPSESPDLLINTVSSVPISTDQSQAITANSSTSTVNQTISSSNYESLTGSESDPNYESVRYVSSYETIQNNPNIDSEDVKKNVSKTTSLSNGDANLPFSEKKPKHSIANECGEVDDYFQV